MDTTNHSELFTHKVSLLLFFRWLIFLHLFKSCLWIKRNAQAQFVKSVKKVTVVPRCLSVCSLLHVKLKLSSGWNSGVNIYFSDVLLQSILKVNPSNRPFKATVRTSSQAPSWCSTPVIPYPYLSVQELSNKRITVNSAPSCRLANTLHKWFRVSPDNYGQPHYHSKGVVEQLVAASLHARRARIKCL